MTGAMKRTISSFHRECESSFLQSLASIHMDSSKSMSRLRRGSAHDEMDTKSKAPQSSPRRRATVSGPAPTGLERPADERRPLTTQGEKATIQGILRCDDDKDAHPRHRVSFSHNEDGTLDRHVSNYTIGSMPKDSAATAATGSTGSRSGSISPKETPRPSLRSSCNWPPPPPPHPSSKSNLASSMAEKNLAAMFQSNPDNNIDLPFPTSSAARRPSRPLRRYSMLEMEQQKKDTRAASPTFVAPQLQRRSSDGPYQEKTQHKHHKKDTSFRKDYHLGESARSLSHMKVESSLRAAKEKASQLKNYDFAFIKCTSNSWTYAILAYRSVNENGTDPNEECMMFVMNEEGSTKMIKKPRWAEYIRRMVPEDGGSQLREMSEYEFVPRSILVQDGEDCSMISFNSGN